MGNSPSLQLHSHFTCKQLFLLSLLSFNLASPSVASTDWELAEEADGIRVYTRSVPSSTIKEFRATTKIKATLDILLGVMLDPNACSEWVYRCEEARVLEQRSFSDVYVYRVINLPWPVSDRDIVLHKTISQDEKTKEITIENLGAPDFVPRTQQVRIEKTRGTYHLKPLPDGYIELTWKQFSDPGGAIPKQLVNMMLLETPFTTLRNLKEMVTKTKYQEARLRHDAREMIEGFEVKPW